MIQRIDQRIMNIGETEIKTRKSVLENITCVKVNTDSPKVVTPPVITNQSKTTPSKK